MTMENQRMDTVESALRSPERLASLAETGLLDTVTEPAFDRVTMLAQRLINAPVVLVSLVDDHRQFFKSAIGLPEPWATQRETPLSHSFCQYVVADAAPFEVEDARTHPRVLDNKAIDDLGVVAYLGVPLTTSDGQVLGAFCAIDTEARAWTEEERARLADFAALTMTEVELRQALKETRKAQKEQEDTKRFLEQINSAVPVIIYVVDVREQRNVYSNRGIADVLGYTPEQVQAMGSDLFPRLLHPDDLKRLPEQNALIASLSDGVYAEFEYRMRHANGTWRWLRSRDTIFQRDEAGNPIQLLGTAEDVTERKEADAALQTMTTNLQRSNQALQEFASVASHDLQEPLRKILSFGSRLESRHGQSLTEEGHDYLRRMLRSAERMQALVSDLLTYSRVTARPAALRPVSLDDILRDVLSDLEAQLLRVEGVVKVVPLPTVMGDPSQMRQLFQNLLGNALKFHRPGVPPLVRVQGQRKANGIEIVVSDNGVGFEPHYAERIFEVFERLNERDRYEGTGIGLAICRRIVERHGGTICATGEPGVGASFTLWLPLPDSDEPENLPLEKTLETGYNKKDSEIK